VLLPYLYALRHDLFTQEHLGEFAEKAKRLAAEARREQQRRELAARTRLIEVEKQIENLVKHFTDGLATRTTKEKLEALEVERDRLLAPPQEENIIEKIVTAVPSLVEHYRMQLADVEKFKDEGIPALRELIAAVTGDVIRLVPSGGVLRAEVQGRFIGLWKNVSWLGEQSWLVANAPATEHLQLSFRGTESMVAGERL
jgi:hypothetical protein